MRLPAADLSQYGDGRPPYQGSVQITTGPCFAPIVFVDNEAHNDRTELTLEVVDFPGLLRVVAWVLNGLGVRVHSAHLKTTEDGIAQDVFLLTDYAGRKLSPGAAESVAERLQDFVIYCKPDIEGGEPEEYASGNITISNKAHQKYTEVVIREQHTKPGFVLEVASVITGIGLVIKEAVIKRCDDCALATLDLDLESLEPQSRVLCFWVVDSRGQKLDYPAVSALVYTLGLIMGKGNLPTVAPNLQLAATR